MNIWLLPFFSILVNIFISTYESYFDVFFLILFFYPSGKGASEQTTVWHSATCQVKPQHQVLKC